MSSTTKTSKVRKATTSPKAASLASRSASAKSVDTAVVVSETVDVVAGPELKKPELIDLVVERSGIKKRFAKPTIEAALAVLGEALAEGRTLNLKPMGKAKVQKSKEIARGRVLSLRMRQQNAAGTESDSDPLAEAAE